MKTFISISICFLISSFCPGLISTVQAQWHLQGVAAGAGTYPTISVFSPTGIVVADGYYASPKVFISTNSGVNWSDITGNITGPELGCVWAVNSSLIFVGSVGAPGYNNGSNAKVWKTTNGGQNWSVAVSVGGNHGYFNGIVFSRTNPMIGIAMSDPAYSNDHYYLAKTTDGGSTWFTQNTTPTGDAGYFGSVICIDNLFYGFGVNGAPPRVILTTDGGTSWNTMNAGLQNTYVSGFAFSSDKTTGLISNTTVPNISRSTDEGSSWVTFNTGLPLSSSYVSRLIWVYGTNQCYMTAQFGASGCVGKSMDGGVAWTVMNTDNISDLVDINLVYTGGIVYAYAINQDDQVIGLTEPVGVQPINSNVPSEYRLGQNYPNPFNPSTKISFSLPKSGFVKLSVFDLLGREVTALIKEELKPGTYEVNWDASNYPSGVYFYKITSGSFTWTRKMILLK
jgi:photosystem II stability/assembly factor-like uncharacterized protein